MEYLGLWVTRDGIKSINKKIEAIKILCRQLPEEKFCKFIGLVNYFRDMWEILSHMLEPLTKFISNVVHLNGLNLNKNNLNRLSGLRPAMFY